MQKNIDDDDIDLSQFIKNLDTGDTYSVNNFGELEIEFKQYTPLNPKKNRWKNFWTKMEEINEKLYDACEQGDEEVVTRLLKDQIDLKQQVQQQNRSNNSTIIGEDYQEFIGLINIDCKGLDDWTALHHAINNRRVGIVKLLLDSKANPNSCNIDFYYNLNLLINQYLHFKILINQIFYIIKYNFYILCLNLSFSILQEFI